MSGELLPNKSTILNATFNDIKVGEETSVIAFENVKSKKEFVASEVNIKVVP